MVLTCEFLLDSVSISERGECGRDVLEGVVGRWRVGVGAGADTGAGEISSSSSLSVSLTPSPKESSMYLVSVQTLESQRGR